MVYRLALLLSFISINVWAQPLPTYQSTDNSGKGKQGRLNEIESFLIEVSEYSKKLEERLKRQDSEVLDKLKLDQANLKKEIEQLKSENSALKQETLLLRQAIGSLSQTDFQKIEEFVTKMEEGEWEQLKGKVESQQLEIRSLEALIETFQATSSR
jgi:hypothetical protein